MEPRATRKSRFQTLVPRQARELSAARPLQRGLSALLGWDWPAESGLGHLTRPRSMRSPGPADSPGRWWRGLLLLLLQAQGLRCTQLTFELPDSAKQCFHEEMEQGVKFTLGYQVISGGQYDVDCFIEDPHGKTIYKETKKQYDSFFHQTESKGIYKFCFSNEFSTFTHKTVYFDLLIGDEPPILPEMGNRVTALTQMESACVTIHEALKTVIDSQTHYRLREAQDRNRADELNERVSYWSVGETVILFVVSISQVLLLKSFFTEKRPTSRGVNS